MSARLPCEPDLSGWAIGIGIPDMTEFRRINERAVAAAQHDFIITVILARDHEIGDSIPVEVRGRQVELVSPSRQLKRPRDPERSIAGAEKNYGGIRGEIGDGKVKMTVVRKVPNRDRHHRSKSGNVAGAHHVSLAIAEKLRKRAVAVSHNHVEVAVPIEVAGNQRSRILADQVTRSDLLESAIRLAQFDGKKMLAGLVAL